MIHVEWFSTEQVNRDTSDLLSLMRKLLKLRKSNVRVSWAKSLMTSPLASDKTALAEITWEIGNGCGTCFSKDPRSKSDV